MKKVLKYSGAIAAVLAILTFILMMACPVAKYTNGSLSIEIAGTTAIFGKTEETMLGTATTKLAWSGLLAWLFVLLAILILVAGIVLPLVKVTALDKYAGILNLVAVGLLILAGIFMFCSKGALGAANDADLSDYKLGAGWVIGGIISILAGASAILPAAFDFVASKK